MPARSLARTDGARHVRIGSCYCPDAGANRTVTLDAIEPTACSDAELSLPRKVPPIGLAFAESLGAVVPGRQIAPVCYATGRSPDSGLPELIRVYFYEHYCQN